MLRRGNRKRKREIGRGRQTEKVVWKEENCTKRIEQTQWRHRRQPQSNREARQGQVPQRLSHPAPQRPSCVESEKEREPQNGIRSRLRLLETSGCEWRKKKKETERKRKKEKRKKRSYFFDVPRLSDALSKGLLVCLIDSLMLRHLRLFVIWESRALKTRRQDSQVDKLGPSVWSPSS